MKTSSKIRALPAPVAPTAHEPGGSAAEVLVVEDDPEFAELLAVWLAAEGFTPAVVHDGTVALRRIRDREPDLVLLDLNLPGLDGWRLIDEIRAASEVPVIVVTARAQEADRVTGLLAGADDYVTKPVSFPELVARVRATLRRSRASRSATPGRTAVVERGDLRLDLTNHALTVAGVEVHLTPTEFRLLRRLVEGDGALVPHLELLRYAWGASYGADDVPLLRATVRNLRAKLARAAPGRRFIATQYGVGYRLVED